MLNSLIPKRRIPSIKTLQSTAGSSTHEHFHPEEEVYELLEGKIEITIDGTCHIASSGMAAIVPPNIRHSVRALTGGRLIVVDHPGRHDFG